MCTHMQGCLALNDDDDQGHMSGLIYYPIQESRASSFAYNSLHEIKMLLNFIFYTNLISIGHVMN